MALRDFRLWVGPPEDAHSVLTPPGQSLCRCLGGIYGAAGSEQAGVAKTEVKDDRVRGPALP